MCVCVCVFVCVCMFVGVCVCVHASITHRIVHRLCFKVSHLVFPPRVTMSAFQSINCEMAERLWLRMQCVCVCV